MAPRQVDALTYAVRPRVVLKYLGQLSLVVGLLSLIPLAVALLFGDLGFGLRMAVVASLLLAGAAPLARLPDTDRLQSNEALIITALIFLITPIAMSFPMMEQGLSFLDALFEAVSGITTTGLTTLGTVANKSESFLFLRAWMQWYGGLGIVVLSLAFLVRPGATARMFGHTGAELDSMVTGTRLHARRVTEVYLVLTFAGISVLWLVGVDVYSAVLHTLAGISTGGFSNHDDSLAGLGGWVSQATVMVLSFAGAVALALYHPACFRNRSGHIGYLELKGLLAATLAASLLLGLSMAGAGNFSWTEVWTHAPLIAVSAQTGAGFSSMPVEQMGPSSKLVLIGSMLIGGGVGSTTGGIKILRLLILLRLLQIAVRRTCMPSHAVLDPRLGGHRLERPEIEHALLIILVFIGLVFLSWFPFLAMGHDALSSLFDVVSATATVGLSAGVTAPDLAPLLKAVLCMDMLLGRLEVISLLVVLYPAAWRGKTRE